MDKAAEAGERVAELIILSADQMAGGVA